MPLEIHLLALRSIPLDQIDFLDRTNAPSHSPSSSVSVALTESLERSGMLHPPLLEPRSATPLSYRIVYGFTRVRAWAALGQSKEIIARLTPENATRADLLLAALDDNLHDGGRSLNPIDQALAVEKLQAAGYPRQRLIDEILPLFGRRPHPAILDRLLALCTQPPALQDALADGRLSEGLAERLAEFSSNADREAALGLILRLKLSSGAAREYIRLSFETLQRDGGDLDTLFAELDIDLDAELPQRRAWFLDRLRRRRNPILTRLETDYAARHASLALSDAIKIIPPKDFEGRRYRLEARLESRKDLEKTIRLLGRALERHPDAIDALFDPPIDAGDFRRER